VVTGDAMVQLIIRTTDHDMDVLWENHGKGSYINLHTLVLHLGRELQYTQCRR